MKDMKTLCDQVRQVAYDIHVYHGHGHLEKVYENALAHRLSKAGLIVKQQHPINVFDEDGTPIGEYLADLLIEDSLIVELKTAKALAPEHEAQVRLVRKCPAECRCWFFCLALCVLCVLCG